MNVRNMPQRGDPAYADSKWAGTVAPEGFDVSFWRSEFGVSVPACVECETQGDNR
jgi:hypothetical protein